MYDLIIIGGGPTGINCAIAAQEAHLNYLIIEKGVLVNSIFHFPANMSFFSTSKKLEIADTPFISHSDKPTRREALEYYRRIIESKKIKINFREEVLEVKNERIFEVKTNKSAYKAKNIIVATGFYDQPNMLNISGENLPKVKHYYDEVHHYIRNKVLVIGGANSACDVALECWQKGAEVTMVVRSSELYKKTKYWILPNIKNRIKEGSIKAFFDTTVESIKEDHVILNTPEGKVKLDNDYVLAMTGYRPNYPFLERLGIHINDDPYRTPRHKESTLETNVPGIYIAGVINGGMKTNKYFIENTRDHAERIIKDIVLKSSYV